MNRKQLISEPLGYTQVDSDALSPNTTLILGQPVVHHEAVLVSSFQLPPPLQQKFGEN